MCLFVFAFLLIAGFGRAQGDATGSRSKPAGSGAQAERIHPGDVVDVDFVGSFEYDWRGGLSSEGNLDGLDRAKNPVFALCRTEAEVAAAVAEQYSYFLRDPKVVVRIVDRSSRALAYVRGAVRVPQRVQLRRPASLLELIVLAGGITDTSAGEITVFRPPSASCEGAPDDAADKGGGTPGDPARFSIKISDLLSGRAGSNPKIVPGDIINVREAPPIFVMGDVVVQRRMNLTPDLTLLRAIASAGGLSYSFSGQKALIHRAGREMRVLEFDLRKLADKVETDPPLEPYDVIEVEQKGVAPLKIAPGSIPQSADGDVPSKLPLRIVG